jgi:hypothetical protein
MTYLRALAIIVVIAAFSASACAERDPATPEDQRARGEAIIKAMSDRLAAATAISLTTSEEIEHVNRSGESRVDRLTREVKLRRPDRLYFKVTGSRDFEAFYEGERLTLVSHGEKVFGEFKTPPTVDDTIDVLGERYGIAVPIGDLLTGNAHRALMSSQTTGGWIGRDTIDGTICSRLEWRHPNVDWDIWIPESGDPLPRKLHIVYKVRRGRPDSTIVFRDWNLNAAVTDATFARQVPADYEGIAVIQRASAVLTPDQR